MFRKRAKRLVNETHVEVDFASGVPASRDPGIVPAYFYVYGHAGEGYGFTDILELLRLLFPCLCRSQVSVCAAVYGGAALAPTTKKCREMLDTKSSLSSASDRRRFSSGAVDITEY